MTPATVDRALTEFTEKTGIPAVIVVEDLTDVFEKQLDSDTLVVVGFAVVLIIIAIVLIVKAVKNRKPSGGNGPNNGGNNSDGNRYNSSYGNNYNKNYN